MTDVNDPNPYLAPTAATPEQVTIPGALSPARPWTPFEAIEFGWNAIRRAPLIVVILVVAGLITAIPDSIGAGFQVVLSLGFHRQLLIFAILVRVCLMLVGLLLNAWLTLGKSRLKLKVCRGGEAQLPEIFTGGALSSILGAIGLIVVVVVIGLSICLAPGFVLILLKKKVLAQIAMVLGGVVFSIPMLLAAWKIQFFPLIIVDRGANAMESLSTSWRLTNGHMLGLFVFWLLTIALVLAAVLLGALACCVGWIVTFPTALAVLSIAQTYIYLKLTGEEPVLAAG